jgi:hypothetical protein
VPKTHRSDPTMIAFHEAPIGVHKCNAGPKPPLAERIGLAMDMLRYAQLRDGTGGRKGFTCYVVPSSTGGDSDAFVDGKLRQPQCFGSHGEAWAQPGGARWTVHGEEPADLSLAVTPEGWSLGEHLVLGTA